MYAIYYGCQLEGGMRMYAYFEDTRHFWWYLLIVYFVSFPVYAFLRILHLSIWLSVILTLAIELISMIGIINYIVNKANSYMQDILDILFQDCDPYTLEKRIYELSKKPVKNQTQQCILLYYLAIAYAVQGNKKKAFSICMQKQKEIELLKEDAQFLLYHFMLHLMIDFKQYDEANELYTTLLEYNIKKSIYPYNFTEMKQEIGMRLAYVQGDISTLTYVDFIKQQLQMKDISNFYQVLLYERLWKLMKRNQLDKESILCAHYIKHHGNTMQCVKDVIREEQQIP